VGTKKEFPTKAKAEKAAAAHRLDITKEQPQRVKGIHTVEQLANHFIEKDSTKRTPAKPIP